ncbi:helix-turn-helix domain-containing protein [Pantoea dispersa]|uniref:helix-turn-helix domain-containing protein n=1 Tax=Pantoea dispersa TaxID=59814 RepID=UPI0021AF9560|nr:helix-turn-helix transcriptional regulator [Pantoea dispersa]MCT6589220.1 helix-turn-helix domain-containing protein [Pantoea dispersa]
MNQHFSFDLAVRKVARERKWTIKKTAWFCGVSVSTLRQLMNSKHTYISTIEKYAAKFNMSTIVFIEKGQQQW